MDGIVIVGAGECGTRAAFALREAGYSETVTLIGAEPHLPYERPPLSKPASEGVQLKSICTKDALRAARIAYYQGTSAAKLDVHSKLLTLDDGNAVKYDALLLATGASPRRLTCTGAEYVLDFRTYSDARAIFSLANHGARFAIVGGGLIGMELAAVLRGKGVAVSVIEAAPRPLGRAVPARFAAKLHARHVEEGVSFYLGQGIAAITVGAVILSDGTAVPADVTVSAIGVVPEISLAEAAGLATGNGVLTDAGLRTSDPHIYAAGDCAAVLQANGSHVRFECWRNARAQAETAARNMAGTTVNFTTIPWFWSDQYDLGLQVAGLSQPGHASVVRPLSNGEMEFYLDEGRLIAAAGLGTGNSVAKDIKLAEMLIAAGISPDPDLLADPAVNLKSLLKNVRAA
ncbi:NAD(P)/FAD-dependent oxidoreductase [Phyllobacterium myrsinacearum]|uniref:3-phenylpropionate/trans-cinnamate dioxygenase ferredoxin reductase subunit n=1 Tax=Phyllobacterium myrsinacearum TaxID=28101 RepID=A0A839ERZ2_9HYPH|nr:FAD-dependent oxidoreductase [Phyllobacterium myrsinacearum]MBA8879207.1 3-phenylpropionate/trans-cinnamate dioxygenase ferredoxin reductase subunit [Phyllobacterium myrsinacearum]